MKPLLHFDYVNADGRKEPLQFKHPREIIIAYNLEEVLPCLRKIQDFIDQGYYAAGYLSYESAPAFETAFQVNSGSSMPLLWFGIFDQPFKEALESNLEFHTAEWFPQTDRVEYNQSIDQIKNYIAQGDTYQVNYTTRLKSHFQGDPVAYYKQLAASQSANYSAYLHTGDYSILSASPELFFHVKDGTITTKPMKGTIGRGETEPEDQSNAEWLYHSEKNRAENVMIVDLLRNDLGRIAKPGTVRVPELFTIEKYPTVFQMTSTVTAEVDADKNIIDIFKALFPCGSITGAPKVSTMNIIHELETSAREVYCGTIGFITPEIEAIFNVPIRTVMIDHKTGAAQYGVGGGITWDSTNEEEYEEMLTKAKILSHKKTDYQLLESIGIENGSYLVLEEHLDRLKRSAEALQFTIDINDIRNQLVGYPKSYPNGLWKVRLLVSKDGKLEIQVKEMEKVTQTVPVALSQDPVPKDYVFLYHKTTNRRVYEEQATQFPDAFDVLLWNIDYEITEFTMGNVVVEMAGSLYTPPVECGLLAGTYRAALLKEGTISERKILVEELKHCSAIWLINSVRQWIPVQLT